GERQRVGWRSTGRGAATTPQEERFSEGALERLHGLDSGGGVQAADGERRDDRAADLRLSLDGGRERRAARAPGGGGRGEQAIAVPMGAFGERHGESRSMPRARASAADATPRST